jgi:hypothetical protein
MNLKKSLFFLLQGLELYFVGIFERRVIKLA